MINIRIHMLILFDCDGTLVDSHQQIITSMQLAFLDLSLSSPTTAQVADIIGLSLQSAIELLGCRQTNLIADIIERYRFHYHRGSSALFSDTRDVIGTLKEEGHHLGVVTGKSMPGLLSVLEKHHLRDDFLVLRTADCCPSKPHPAMVLESMDEMGASAAQTVVIGDATFDMQMAVAAGVRAFGVSTGSHCKQALEEAGAYRVAPSLDALMALIERV
ncbi:MAG: HAD-IA family hydrolase [Mariprofundaceae bacterium]|nr:HAD-IA family hydrolase [Mariprofundaceae bacterium]